MASRTLEDLSIFGQKSLQDLRSLLSPSRGTSCEYNEAVLHGSQECAYEMFGSTNSAANMAMGVAAVAVAAVGVKSMWNMYSWRYALRDENTKGPAAGPTPLPFIGNILDLRKNYYETLYRYVDKPASVFYVLSSPFLVINDEDGLRRVLGGANGMYTKPKYFGYRSKAVTAAVDSERNKVADESIEYQPNGDTSRKALELMVSDSLANIKLSMHRLLRILEKASETNNAVRREDAVKAVRRCLVGLNLDVLFGLEQGRGCSEDPNRIAAMIEFAGSEFARRMVNPLRILVDIPGNLRFARDVGGLIGLGRRLCKVLDDAATFLFNGMANGAATVTKSISGLSWVHAWVGKVGRIGKLGKVVGLLMASTQTVPLTAVWMLHLVGNDDSVRIGLKEELLGLGVASVLDLRYEDLDRMALADAVIRETLRLYPPFPLIQRQAQGSDVLGGITIPNGTIVYVVPWLVHRNGKYWSDPHAFKPERFLNMNSSHGDAPSDWVYLPFGRGSRMCAGSKLAMTELKVLLAHAVLSFEWESVQESHGRDERFPNLGMIPDGIKMTVRSTNKLGDLDKLMKG